MQMTTLKAMCQTTGWVLLLQILFGCAANAPNEQDKAELEYTLSRSFGASGVSFSPDSKLVAVGTPEKIWVVDTSSLETIASLSYFRAARFGNSKSLQFIDERRLIVGAEGAILNWDVTDNRVTDQISLPDKNFSPRAITWSETTQTLAFSVRAGSAQVKTVHIDQHGFGPVQDIVGYTGVPGDLQFNRDGRYLAATGDMESVLIREVETGQKVGELPTRGYANGLELFGENQLLVSGENIAFWTFLGEEETLEIDNPDLQGQVTGQVAVRVAGTIALGTLTLFAAMLAPLTGDGGGVAELGAATYQIATLPVKTTQQEWCGRKTAISPDGRWLADVYPGITREVIRVFDLKSDVASIHLNPKGKYSCAVKFSPNGKLLLITTEKTARLYDTETWRHRDLKLDKSR